MNIRAVAFDIDGTLYPEQKFFLKCIPDAVKDPLLFYGFCRARKHIRLHDLYEPPFHREQAVRVLKSLHRRADENRIEQIQQRLEKRYYSRWDHLFHGMKPFDGSSHALAELRKRGYLLAAMSDFPVGIKLEVLGLEEHFLFSFSSEEVGYLKPSRVPFMTLCDELGMHPSEVLYVGNSVSKDIAGSRDAGMAAALYRRGSTGEVRSPAPDDMSIAHIEFSSYYEFPDLVDALQDI